MTFTPLQPQPIQDEFQSQFEKYHKLKHLEYGFAENLNQLVTNLPDTAQEIKYYLGEFVNKETSTDERNASTKALRKLINDRQIKARTVCHLQIKSSYHKNECRILSGCLWKYL